MARAGCDWKYKETGATPPPWRRFYQVLSAVLAWSQHAVVNSGSSALKCLTSLHIGRSGVHIPALTVKTWGLNFWPPTVESAGVYWGRRTAQTGSSLAGSTGWQCNTFMEGSHYAAGSSEHVNLKYVELLKLRLIFYTCILQLFGGLEDCLNSYPIWSTSNQYRCFHPKPTFFCQSVLRCACSRLDWSLPQRAVFLSKLGGEKLNAYKQI